jgi:hypothetical protein
MNKHFYVPHHLKASHEAANHTDWSRGISLLWQSRYIVYNYCTRSSEGQSYSVQQKNPVRFSNLRYFTRLNKSTIATLFCDTQIQSTFLHPVFLRSILILTYTKILFYLTTSHHTTIRPLRVTAGSAALDAITVYPESGSTHSSSMCCSKSWDSNSPYLTNVLKMFSFVTQTHIISNWNVHSLSMCCKLANLREVTGVTCQIK